MTNLQKKEIIQLIENEKARLGSYSSVANKCEVSDATINQLRQDKYQAEGDEMWIKVATSLGYTTKGWEVVETTNIKLIRGVLMDAKKQSMFMAISEKAGSCKSEGIAFTIKMESSVSIYKISCREWSKRDFLNRLCRTLGINPTGVKTLDELTELIIVFFNQRRLMKPLLIIDEADKLKPAAIRTLIPLYNETDGELGLVIAGTENLEKEMKKGVKMAAKGYDELDSRFGRSFIHLPGSTLSDVRKICSANGINNLETQNEIFQECEPQRELINRQNIQVVKDHRRLKRIIQRHLIKTHSSNN